MILQCCPVPSSNPRMLLRSLASPADTIIYDLEDSVAPAHKHAARTALRHFLAHHSGQPRGNAHSAVAIRVNAVGTEWFDSDVRDLLHHPSITTLVLPKTHSPQELDALASAVHATAPGRALEVVASIESARAMWGLGAIAGWRAQQGGGAVTFAAEDYCADTGIQRTRSRRELLYPRARLATAAKAFGLRAIDMVCVDYKDEAVAREEAQEAREMGYDGKQAIHPSQVPLYNALFVPSPTELRRAALILAGMERANARDGAGAFGLDIDGRSEMIDEPMVKQARELLRRASAAGVHVPDGGDG
ncbi:beta subunit of citrate lyase [Calocera cornea HHB12733]|uniref:Beta subunit of citrate lyase n=1 Tax=Calocera cornea HHB12733 TaxID=1353952 RepID=A0A165GPJ7_9BASI|nr:beta subunit of citrate lyase [Calocera cornea HHB12733]